MKEVDNSWTLKELYAECKHREIGGCSHLNKPDLIHKLNHGPTVEELKAKCKKLGLSRYSHLNKAGLISFLEAKPAAGEEAVVEGKGRGKKHAGPKEKPSTSSGKTGPLQPIAQKEFDDGPTKKDGPGAVYVYFEPGGTKNEWKVGKTTEDPPERRMHTTAKKNGATYHLKKSWSVKFHGLAERIVHAELNDYSIPRKQVAGGGEWADGGKEWFKADYDVVERAILLARRTIAVHYP